MAVRLLQVFSDPDVRLDEIIATLQSDPAIAAKILRAANSSAYGIGRQIRDLHQAVALLGKNVVTSLAMTFSLADDSLRDGPGAELYRSYWLQSVTQALTAECLARRYARAEAGEWFVTGLLANIGRLALLKQDVDGYAAVLQCVDDEERHVHECEAEMLGVTAISLSADYLEEWGLPRRWVEAMREQQHLGFERAETCDPLSAAVAIAMATGDYFCTRCRAKSLIHIDHLMASVFHATEEDVGHLFDAVRTRLESTSDLFEVDVRPIGSAADLMSHAMQHLADLLMADAGSARQEDPEVMLLKRNDRLLDRIRQLMHQNTLDPLTGVTNRGHFMDLLKERVAESIAQSQPIGLLLADIDYFKTVNDTYGHLAGDTVLENVAQVLRSAIRKEDVLARYGGDEFVVLVRNVDPTILHDLGERLRRQVENARFSFEGRSIPVRISVGGAIGQPRTVVDDFPKSLIATADRAMYAAKSRGRNRLVLPDPTSTAQAPLAECDDALSESGSAPFVVSSCSS